MEARLRQLEAELEAVRQELQTAHEKQRTGDEAFRRFSESGLLGIALFQISGTIVFANDAFLRMIGWDSADLGEGAMRWGQLTPPEWAEHAAEALEALKTHRSCDPFEAEYLRRDGTRFWGLFTGVRVDDRNIAAFLFDVTERKRAELAVRESEARYRTLVQALSQSVWRLDADGRPVDAQTGWHDRTEQTPGESDPWRWLEALHPEDREPTRAAWVYALESQTPFSAEYRVRSASGDFRYMAIRGIPRRDEAGSLREWVGTVTDITERKRLEETLRKHAEELRRADHAKDLFLAMLGHELRTPLSTLQGTLQLIHRQRHRYPDLVSLHARMERQVQRIGRLVDDVQDVSRIVRGRLSLRCEPLDLVQLVRETAEDQRGGLEERNLTFRCELPAEPILVSGDRTRLIQVLVNLLHNAGKFTDPGGEITVRLGSKGERVTVEVVDTGIGVDPALLPNLFDSFTQAESSLDRSRGGLGLGLALVKGIVENHGGQVWATSPGPARGAAFSFDLPRMPERRPEPEPPAVSSVGEGDDDVHAGRGQLHPHRGG
jgi:PAS domain S-box-containing protein